MMGKGQARESNTCGAPWEIESSACDVRWMLLSMVSSKL